MTADCSFVTGLALSRLHLQQQGCGGMGSLQTLSTLVSYFKMNTHTGGRTECFLSSEKLRHRMQVGMYREHSTDGTLLQPLGRTIFLRD